MTLDVGAAVLAGVLPAQPMEAPVYLQRALGLPVHQDVFAEGGSLLGAPPRARRLVGWLGHGTLAALLALLYASAAEAAGLQHRLWLWLWGLLGGLVHGLVGGVVVGLFPTVAPHAARVGGTACSTGGTGCPTR